MDKESNNILWLLTAAIIILNYALVLFCRRSLPEILPLHIGLDGSYADTMAYTRLFLYPATSLVLAVILFLGGSCIFKRFPKLDDPQGIRFNLVQAAACCFALIILSSTCVSLTMGQKHFFMFAEPIIFVVLIAGIIIGECRICKAKKASK